MVWGVSVPRGVSVPGGSGPGGCLVQGVSAPGGVSALGVGVCSRGGLVQGGGGIPACTEADPLPPVNRMTNRCKNIALATTSLRPVINTTHRGFQVVSFR